MNHPNQHHSQQQQRHEPPYLPFYSQTQAQSYSSSTNLTQSHQHVLPQSNIPMKRSLETSPSPSPPSAHQPLVCNTNTNTNPSFNTSTTFEHRHGQWYASRILPAPIPTRAPGQWQWQGQTQTQTQGQSRTWNSTINKTYAQRFKERAAVFQDAEYPETKTKTGNVSVKKPVKRLLSPFESDPERTHSEMETDSESTTDSEATEIENDDEDEDDEVLLLPEYRDPVEMLIEDFKSNPRYNPKPKHQLQPQPQFPPSRLPGWQTTESHALLSNDAISNILLQCRPQSPKAKEWIAEHEAKKVADARMTAANSRGNTNSNERGGLRRRVLQLRPKNEWNIWQSRERVVSTDNVKDRHGMKMAMGIETEVESSRLSQNSNGISGLSLGIPESERQHRGEVKAQSLRSIFDKEVEAVSVGVPMTMNRGGNVGPAHLLNETDRRIYGAMKASSRLQYLMCDHEDPADMSSRVKRELQNVFAMPRERQY